MNYSFQNRALRWGSVARTLSTLKRLKIQLTLRRTIAKHTPFLHNWPMPRPTRTHWLLLSAIVFFYGNAFLLIKISLTGLSPLTLVFGRLAIAFLCLALASIITKAPWPTTGAQWRGIIALAAIGNAMPFCLIAWGQLAVSSSVTGMLMGIMPIVIVSLAHILIPDESLNATKILGFALGFCGVATLIGWDSLVSIFSGSNVSLIIHELAILTGALGYAAAAVLTRKIAPVHPLSGSAAVLLCAALLVLPFALPLMNEWLNAPWPALAAVAGLGAFPTGLASVFYFIVIRQAGPSFFAIANYLVPVLATIIGAALGHEAITSQEIFGLTLILGGVAITQLGIPKRQGSGA